MQTLFSAYQRRGYKRLKAQNARVLERQNRRSAGSAARADAQDEVAAAMAALRVAEAAPAATIEPPATANPAEAKAPSDAVPAAAEAAPVAPPALAEATPAASIDTAAASGGDASSSSGASGPEGLSDASSVSGAKPRLPAEPVRLVLPLSEKALDAEVEEMRKKLGRPAKRQAKPWTAPEVLAPPEAPSLDKTFLELAELTASLKRKPAVDEGKWQRPVEPGQSAAQEGSSDDKA